MEFFETSALGVLSTSLTAQVVGRGLASTSWVFEKLEDVRTTVHFWLFFVCCQHRLL